MIPKHKLQSLWDTFLWYMLPRFVYVRLRDRCEICYGHKGGVRGNENIVYVFGNKIRMCDYCHYEHEMRMRTIRKVFR